MSFGSPSAGEDSRSGPERRRQTRHSVRLHALVLLPDDELLTAHTVDLSIGGACLSVPNQLLVDDEIRLQLEFEAVGEKRNVLLVSRVCYCMPHTNGYRAGVQFVQVKPEDAVLIERQLS